MMNATLPKTGRLQANGRYLLACLTSVIAMTLNPAISNDAGANDLVLDVAVSDSPVERGQRLYIDVLATNTGGGAVANAVVQFTVPPNTTVARSTLWGANSHTCSSGTSSTCNTNALMTLNLGTVPSSVSRLVRVPFTVSGSIPVGDLPHLVTAEFSASHTGSVGPSSTSAQTQVVFANPLSIRIVHGHVVTDPLADRAFEIVIGNTGATAINNHSIHLELPLGTVLVSAEGGTQVGNAIQWPIQQLPAGNAMRRKVVLRNTEGQASARIPLEASIRSGSTVLAGSAAIIPSRPDSPLAMDVSVSREPALRDERYVYRVSVTNLRPAGGSPLENVQIGMHIPENVHVRRQEVLSGASTGCTSGTSAQCSPLSVYSATLDLLLPGETQHLDIPVLVASNAPFGALTHAQFLASIGDDRERFMASETSAIYQTRPLQVSWSTEEEPLTPQGLLEQRLTVTNAGGAAAQNLDLIATLPPGVVVLDADGGDQQGEQISWQLDGLAAGRNEIRRLVLSDSGSSLNRWLKFNAELTVPGSNDSLVSRSGTSVALAESPSLHLAASVANSYGLRSQRIRYRLTAQNTNSASGAPLENTRIYFVVPQHMSYRRDTVIGATNVACSSGTSSTCSSGSLATLGLDTLMAGEGRTVQIDFEIESGAPFGALSPVQFLVHSPDTTLEWTYSGNATVTKQTLPIQSRLTSSAVPQAPSGEYEYHALIANSGAGVASSVGIELRLPANTQIIDSGGGTVIGDSVFWQHVQIAAGWAAQHRVRYHDTSGAASRDLPAELSVMGSVDGTLRKNRSSETAFIGLQTPISIAFNPVPDQTPGSSFTLSVIVRNNANAGGAPLENVSFQMIVPENTTVSRGGITGASNQCSTGTSSTCNSRSRLTLSIGSLQPGESRIVELPINIASATPLGTILETRATAFANTPSAAPVPPATTASTTVVGQTMVALPDAIFQNGFELP